MAQILLKSIKLIFQERFSKTERDLDLGEEAKPQESAWDVAHIPGRGSGNRNVAEPSSDVSGWVSKHCTETACERKRWKVSVAKGLV